MTNTVQITNGVTPEMMEWRYKQLVVSSEKILFDVVEDIKNVNGVLLAKSGKYIDKSTCEKLLRHKLMRPLDEYLQFTNQISEASLVEDIIQLGATTLAGTNLSFDSVMKSINDIVKGLQYDNTLLNKLTVYKYDSTDKFDHSLSVALLAVEIGKAMNFSSHQLAELFSVCLFHDIGEMHIEKSIYCKEELNDNDYRTITTHPVLSYVLLRESKTVFSAQVLSAILNHHERLDHSGYPRNLGERHINRYARILAVADTYDALRRKGRSLVDALSTMKIHCHSRSIAGEPVKPAFDPELIEVLQSLLNTQAHSGVSSTDVSYQIDKDQLQELLFTLNAIHHDIVQLWGEVEVCLANETFGRFAKQLQQARRHLYKVKDLILASSGFVGSDHRTILNGLLCDEAVLPHIGKDLYRMAPELKNQLACVTNMLNSSKSLAADPRLESIVSINRAAYKKCNDLYRATVVRSTLH